MFVPDKVQLPVPLLVTLVAPTLLPTTDANTPPIEPSKVSVRADVPVYASDPVFVQLRMPEPEASMKPLLPVRVNSRSVLAVAPVYLSVPPSRTRLAATFVDAPMLLLAPPFAREDTLKVPPEIVVTPV